MVAIDLMFDDVSAPPTALNGAISSPLSTSGTFVVASSTGYSAATGVTQFRCRIDNEYYLVTNVSGTTWTAIGGQEGSTATTHLTGAAVTFVLTAGGLANSPALPFPKPRTAGLWYYTRFAENLGNSAPTLNCEYAAPWVVNPGETISGMGTFIGTGGSAGSVVRFGLRSDTGGGLPGTLIVDAGTVPSTTSQSGTYQSLTLSYQNTLSAQLLIWLIAVTQVAAAASLQFVQNVSIQSDLIGASSIGGANNDPGYISGATVSGALPGSAPTYSPNFGYPKIFVKV